MVTTVSFMAGIGSLCSRYGRYKQSNLHSCISRRDIDSNLYSYFCSGGVDNFFSLGRSFYSFVSVGWRNVSSLGSYL